MIPFVTTMKVTTNCTEPTISLELRGTGRVAFMIGRVAPLMRSLWFRMPAIGYRIRHQWAFGQRDFDGIPQVWWWPFIVYGAYAVWFALSRSNGMWSLLSLVLFSALIDVIVPTVQTYAALDSTFPFGGLYAGMLMARVVIIAVVTYIVVHNERRKQAPPWKWSIAAFAVFLWLSSICLGMGGYVLVPILYFRYQFTV